MDNSNQPNTKPKFKLSKRTIIVLLVVVVFAVVGYFVYAYFVATDKDNDQPTSASGYEARAQAKKDEYLDEIASMEASEGEDDSAILWTQLVVFYESKDYQRAVDSGTKLLTREKYNSKISLYIYLADSYRELGNRSDEIAMINNIIKLAAKNPDVIDEKTLTNFKDRL